MINANGEYVYHFADAAGNLTEKVVKVDSIIDKDLSLTFSLASDGTDSKEVTVTQTGKYHNGVCALSSKQSKA